MFQNFPTKCGEWKAIFALFLVSLVALVDYFSGEAAQKVITPVGVFQEMIHEPGGCERHSGGERAECRSLEDRR